MWQLKSQVQKEITAVKIGQSVGWGFAHILMLVAQILKNEEKLGILVPLFIESSSLFAQTVIS